MKQGSADDPFAENKENSTDDEKNTSGQESTSIEHDTTGSGNDVKETSTPTDDRQDENSLSEGGRPSLPYIHSRDGVKDDRTQRPVFLREHIETGIDDLVDQMETEFGEDVYKTDVTEAAMAVAQENPELVATKLEEWGYGWS